jgi:hypothetical protein
LRFERLLHETIPLLLLTALGFLVMGYHPGYEDDGVYLSAVKADLNPALYPHNANFFRLQMQATVFDGWMAHFVSLASLPLPWAELIWQLVALFAILWASRKIAAFLFPELCAQWAAVAMVGAMFTLPVAGTALIIADQHLHPRNLATALILIAITRILDGKRWQAVPFLLLGALLHPIMGALGVSFSVFLGLALLDKIPSRLRALQKPAAAAVPLGWILAPASSSWREALASRSYYSLYRWAWYEWIGDLAPLLLFWILWRVAEKRGQKPLARFALAVFAFGIFQQAVAMLLLAPPALIRLAPFQPMRFLHLIYLLMALAGGGLLGRAVLKTVIWRWALYLALLNGGMFLVEWEFIDEGVHLELPGMVSANPWLQAFDWVRQNTPMDAYFALDPRYLAEPGEGFHSFRALAERSQIADAIKDTAVVTEVPSLAPIWHRQNAAQANWANFQLADYERLKTEFGVDWVLVKYPQPPGLDCRWHNAALAVCRIP